jgi:hypothetical protein
VDNDTFSAAAVAGGHNIRDQTVDVVVRLDNVYLCMSEYVPLGTTQINQLNQKLRVFDRVQQGMLTCVVPKPPHRSVFQHNLDSVSRVQVLESAGSRFLNLETTSYEPGKQQLQWLLSLSTTYMESASHFSHLRG